VPVDRPTFSESWYRVADLRPRLRSTVQVHRQHFRGQMWHVLQDPSNNQYFRLNDSAYYFVAMLDGRRTVAQVWRACNEELGDRGPTQGEAIQLLGQLYTSNLLQGEMPPDAEGLLKRYRKRRTREVQGYLMSLLFIRIPLIDPERFLQRWHWLFGWIFGWVGGVLWIGLMASAIYAVIGEADRLFDPWGGMFNPANLPLLYAALVITKVCHEFGHSFCCKRFGQRTGSGGEVHTMGVMFLVFMPLPYMDASSAHAFRSKWQRAFVGAAGMYVELAIAAVAALIWVRAEPGTTLAGLCYNIMFIASVSSLLFNGNALLRFDAYYILSDLLEVPNLAQRSRQYLSYLVKKYVYGVRRPQNPAHTRGERFWFVVYGLASTAYRVFIFTMILLFLTRRLPKPMAIVAVVFGVVAACTWLLVPLGKLVHYLATSPELMRQRRRAVLSTVAFAAAVVVGAGVVSAPRRLLAESVYGGVREVRVRALVAGTVDWVRPDGARVAAGDVLVRCRNDDLRDRRRLLAAEKRALQEQRDLAEDENEKRRIAARIAAADQRLDVLDEAIENCVLRARFAGTWTCPDAGDLPGRPVQPGDVIGELADLSRCRLRVVLDQDAAALVEREAASEVEIRARGRPDPLMRGRIVRFVKVGQRDLPSPALGYPGG